MILNKLILKFIFLFSSVFERFGVDPERLHIILDVKLKMDERRPNIYMGNRQKQHKTHKNSSVMAVIMLLIMGFFMMFILIGFDRSLLGHVLYFSVFMVLISLTLISDFTSVLIDVRDNYIILPRPVNDITVTVSRILHIGIHVGKLVGSLCLPALVYLVIGKGFVASAVFLLEVFSATALTLFTVNIVYLLVLKLTSPQRFKDFISYFQIVFAIVIFGSYQLLPRLIAESSVRAFDVLSYKISYILPPVWLAAFYDILLKPSDFTWLKLILAVTGIVAPFISMIIVFKVLAPGFNRKLSAIAGGSEEAPGTNTNTAYTFNTGGMISLLSGKFMKDPVEQAGFRLTWWLTSRYRDFKVKVYPAFAYVPVYFAYFIFFRKASISMSEKMEALKNSREYILLVYLTSFVLITVLRQISQSEKYKAAWVMFATPHNKPGRIISGMYKALIIKYFVPYFLVIGIFCLWMWGPAVLNDLLLAFFNIVIYGLITALFTVKYLPFSHPANNDAQSGRVIMNLLMLVLVGSMGLAHYALSRWEWVISVLVVLSALLCYVLFYYFQRRNWEALEADYS